MRKLTFVLAVGIALMAISCNKTAELPDGGPATFGVSAIGETYFPKLAKNGSQKITFCATTEDNGVKEQLTATFKVGDSSLVAIYNASAPEELRGVAFPTEACSFTKNDVTIDRYNKNSRTASLTVTNTSTMVGDKIYVLPVQIASVEGSKNASVNPDAVVFYVFYALNLDKGKGTQAEPYLIYEAEDLLNMADQVAHIGNDAVATKEAFAAATPTYYRMVNDVDMAGINWEPLNSAKPYDQKVSFDGNHKTIKNLTYNGESGKEGGMFAHLAGEVYNLNLIDANITTSKGKSGLLCGYCGSDTGITGTVHGCQVTGNLNVNESYVGGIAGLFQGGEIYECLVDASINMLGKNRYYAGGIIGDGQKKDCYIHDCIVKGSVESAGNLEENTYNRNVAGIAGAFDENKVAALFTIENCICLAKIHCNAIGGGIVGHLNANGWASADLTYINNTVKGCIAWNDEINVDNTIPQSILGKRDDYAMGGGCIMGWGCPENTLQNCWRKPGIVFHTTKNGEETHAQPFDQEDSGHGNPLQGINCDYKTFWESMYHGKAAGASETASQVAKRIGWDENVWDFSGDVPALKNVYADK